MSETIITITGPSGAGKTTLESMLCRAPEKFARIVSTTSRPKRAGEGDDAYRFVSREEFGTIEMVEHVEFNGHLYGVSADELRRVLALGRTPVIVVEPNGQGQIEQWADKNGYYVLAVLVDCPVELRVKRLLARFITDQAIAEGPITEQQVNALIERLMSTVTVEMDWADETWRYGVIIRLFDENTEERVVEGVIGTLSAFEDAIKMDVDPALAVDMLQI